MSSVIRIVICMVFIILAGCGVYSFSPSSKPPFESINVPQFENNTIEYQLSDRLTDAVIDGFIRENLVKVQEVSQAEAILYGTVTNYRRDPYTYDQEDIVTEYAVKVTVRVKVTRANSEDVVWEDDFYAQGIYNADEESEEDGQNRAISLITSDIMDRTTKSW